MNISSAPDNLRKTLKGEFKGDIFTDISMRLIHATDASAYREVPLAVVRPRDEEDLRVLIKFARENKIPLIPRAAGTSLAGQVVGHGIVVDIGKYMNRILEINPQERWVRVQPGVVLDELNKILKPTGLFFAPETSTSNRCMIGGMVGNNSCGAHSLLYGSTREHTLEIVALLSDGSKVTFKDLSINEFHKKRQVAGLEGKLYQQIYNILSNTENQENIRKEYPDPEVKRRNTGYALDLLLECEPFTQGGPSFNFCRLLAGSEGTLAFVTEIKLNLIPLPPPVKALVCVHLRSVSEALKANLIALRHQPSSVELMDKTVLDLTRENRDQEKNRFFVVGDPGAILITEFEGNSLDEFKPRIEAMESEMRAAGLGYAFPLVTGSDINKVWNLRKAGLGVLSNMPGDAKPVPVIEDTAVKPELLPAYIEEFDELLKKHGLSCVYYAHIATGELHLRPVLNLKDPNHVRLFREIALETAKLVKKYRGSLSGEHGDGRLRGEFIPLMLGEKNYRLLQEIKKTWDPEGIFNPGKITDTPRMDTHLRYEPGQQIREIATIFDFSKDMGIIRAAERCNGSGDCRKTEVIGGTMCPSYMATRDENATTRARANILREFLTRSTRKNPFDHKEIYEIMDLCLSCKACKSECPSNVDVAKLKSEFLQHYYDAHGIPFRALLIAYFPYLNFLGSLFPSAANIVLQNRLLSGVFKKITRFATQRSIPKIRKENFTQYIQATQPSLPLKGKVYLFLDEFTRFNDTIIGVRAIQLLSRLGYQVVIPRHTYSGRTFISKGLLRKARRLADKNVSLLADIVNDETPLIGIEPSAILSFRDEYPELCSPPLREKAKKLASNALLFEEFFMREFKKGKISQENFTDQAQDLLLHGHCQQKAVASTRATIEMLSIPRSFKIKEIPSGCCGMAGSFGYEKEHYQISMKVGELVLFPAIRNSFSDTLIAAPGTSCRHQIHDGTGRLALHPIEIMYKALKN
ncbi:MAG: FAD-binding and (Fe-S)-binding domain-containing protein [Bacteroidales bacterium]